AGPVFAFLNRRAGFEARAHLIFSQTLIRKSFAENLPRRAGPVAALPFGKPNTTRHLCVAVPARAPCFRTLCLPPGGKAHRPWHWLPPSAASHRTEDDYPLPIGTERARMTRHGERPPFAIDLVSQRADRHPFGPHPRRPAYRHR